MVADIDGPTVSNVSRKPLIVFSDDWGRHPSSCQHLVSRLLDEFDVTWVNTIGTRRPNLNWGTLKRGFGKLRQWVLRARLDETHHCKRADNPRVVNPIMWPSFNSRWQRRLNQMLLSQYLKSQVTNLSEAVVLTTIPIVADLPATVVARRWVYYCVDDFSSWPGLDGPAMQRMEELLVTRCDSIVAAGANLAERVGNMGKRAHVVTHGVDLAHWTGDHSIPQSIAELPKPRVVYWGLIDRRLDLHWLKALDQAMAGGSIALVGPTQDPDSALSQLKHVYFTGALPLEELPGAASAANVLIMPYADLPVTRAMQPLKLKEYLATGKPVVASPLPALNDWLDCLDVANSASDFANMVNLRCGQGLGRGHAEARRPTCHGGLDTKGKRTSIHPVDRGVVGVEKSPFCAYSFPLS